MSLFFKFTLIENISIGHCMRCNYLQISALKILNVPMIVSEQNPEALGKTIPQFDISGAKGPFAKTRFSMYIPEVSICIHFVT